MNNSIFRTGQMAVIPFIVAGDPTPGFTQSLLAALPAAGADLIELGLPFSDPVAEGAVIQAGDERALAAGFTTDTLFDLLRASAGIPVSLRTYMNPILNYGIERFVRAAAECGVYALAVPDLPCEESGELRALCRGAGMPLIPVVAPTSQARVEAITADAAGYVRCMPSPGVTEIAGELVDMYERVRRHSRLPIVMELADIAPQALRALPLGTDGVIINQAVVECIERHGKDAVAPACELVASVVRALRGAVL